MTPTSTLTGSPSPVTTAFDAENAPTSLKALSPLLKVENLRRREVAAPHTAFVILEPHAS